MTDQALVLNRECMENNATEEALREFVGRRADYYIAKWSRMSERKTFRSWNWSAFFAGLLWVGYRKMYKQLLLLTLLMIPVDIVELFLRTNALSSTYGLVAGLYLAFFGNRIYYKSSLKKIEKHQSQNMSGGLKRLGGTSWLGVGLTILFILAYMFLDRIYYVPF